MCEGCGTCVFFIYIYSFDLLSFQNDKNLLEFDVDYYNFHISFFFFFVLFLNFDMQNVVACKKKPNLGDKLNINYKNLEHDNKNNLQVIQWKVGQHDLEGSVCWTNNF